MAEIQTSPKPIWRLWSSWREVGKFKPFQPISSNYTLLPVLVIFQGSTWNTLTFTAFRYGSHGIAPKEHFQCRHGMKITPLQGLLMQAGSRFPPIFSFFVKYCFLMVTFPLYFSNFDCRKQKPCLDKYAFCKSASPGRTNRQHWSQHANFDLWPPSVLAKWRFWWREPEQPLFAVLI